MDKRKKQPRAHTKTAPRFGPEMLFSHLSLLSSFDCPWCLPNRSIVWENNKNTPRTQILHPDLGRKCYFPTYHYFPLLIVRGVPQIEVSFGEKTIIHFMLALFCALFWLYSQNRQSPTRMLYSGFILYFIALFWWAVWGFILKIGSPTRMLYSGFMLYASASYVFQGKLYSSFIPFFSERFFQ